MKKTVSLKNQLFIVLAAGIVAGTFFANFPGRAYIGQVGIFSSSYQDHLASGSWDSWNLFLYLCAQRLIPPVALFFLSFTRWRNPALCLCCFWCFFSLGIFWASCIVLCGIKGILLFMFSLLPHGLLYGWGGLQMGKLFLRRVRGVSYFVQPMALLVLGVVSEAWVHPYILRFLFQIFSILR